MEGWNCLAKLIKLQRRLVDNGVDPSMLEHFIYEETDQIIYDPFMDETGRFPVDPVEYYGDCFRSSVFMDYMK